MNVVLSSHKGFITNNKCIKKCIVEHEVASHDFAIAAFHMIPNSCSRLPFVQKSVNDFSPNICTMGTIINGSSSATSSFACFNTKEETQLVLSDPVSRYSVELF